jgi:DNA-binding MarR family transcriptional regulator
VPGRATRDNLGFLLAKASQRWNERLAEAFARAGYGDVSPSYGSILLPLFEEDGLRIGELARRARLSKQAMTTMVKVMERKGLITRRRDPDDARAALIRLTARTRGFRPTAERVLQELDRRVHSRLSPAQVVRLSEDLKILIDL